MMRTASSNSGRRLAAALGTALVALSYTGCDDDPLGVNGHETVTLSDGLTSYLVVSSVDGPKGSIITVEARVRAVDVDLTPTAFVVNLRYDTERLEVLESVVLGDDVFRVVNLEAGHGRIKAVGAAPSGLGSETMVIVSMRVKKTGYAETLSHDLEELVVTQQNFADLASQVYALSRVVSAQTAARSGL